MTLATGTAPAFVRACERFFALCEEHAGDDLERLHRLVEELTALHFLAVRLPPLDAEMDVPGGGFPFQAVRRRVAAAFPDLGSYSSCDDPLGVDGTPALLRRDALDDLTRLHGQLAEGYDLWRQGMRRDAVHRWREGFQAGWRVELLSVVGLVHEMLE